MINKWVFISNKVWKYFSLHSVNVRTQDLRLKCRCLWSSYLFHPLPVEKSIIVFLYSEQKCILMHPPFLSSGEICTYLTEASRQQLKVGLQTSGQLCPTDITVPAGMLVSISSTYVTLLDTHVSPPPASHRGKRLIHQTALGKEKMCLLITKKHGCGHILY